MRGVALMMVLVMRSEGLVAPPQRGRVGRGGLVGRRALENLNGGMSEEEKIAAMVAQGWVYDESRKSWSRPRI